MDNETISFRWGVAGLDEGFTDVPNLFLDYYSQAGVKREEFLVIIHLARYQYERPDSECRPSVETVARQMGYTDRALRKILAQMEKRGLVVRDYRPGKTTIYDFSGFSRKVLECASRAREVLEDRPEPEGRGTPEPQFPPPRYPGSSLPRNWGSAEEQQDKKTRKSNTYNKRHSSGSVLVPGRDEREEILAVLEEFGVIGRVAEELAACCSLKDVQDCIANVRAAKHVGNPQGWVVNALRNWHGRPTGNRHHEDESIYTG